MTHTQTITKKVCLLGDFAVGKTSLIRRFVFNMFDDKYLSTIGVKISRKPVTLTTPTSTVDLNMMLWDLAGKNGFRQVWTSYLRGASAGVLVCDLTRRDTLTSLPDYADELRQINPQARLIVAANKSDLPDQQVTLAEVAAIAAACNAPHYVTSARTAASVEEVFSHLAHLLV